MCAYTGRDKMDGVSYVIVHSSFKVFPTLKVMVSIYVDFFSAQACWVIKLCIEWYSVAFSKSYHEVIIVYSIFRYLSVWFDDCRWND